MWFPFVALQVRPWRRGLSKKLFRVRAGDGGDILLESFDKDSVQAESTGGKKRERGGRRRQIITTSIQQRGKRSAAAGLYSQNEIGGWSEHTSGVSDVHFASRGESTAYRHARANSETDDNRSGGLHWMGGEGRMRCIGAVYRTGRRTAPDRSRQANSGKVFWGTEKLIVKT